MPLALDVSLLSGRRVSLEAEPDHSVSGLVLSSIFSPEPNTDYGAIIFSSMCTTLKVKDLKRRAEVAFRVGRGRLLTSSGSFLDEDAPLKRAKLQHGDLLTLQISPVQICRGHDAFAAVLGDRSVVTWGNPLSGGDSKAAQSRLKNVQRIQSTRSAFAAILADGCVVTWGDARSGGNSSAVQDQLKNVRDIQSTYAAFAAVLADGSVVTWGCRGSGGNSSSVQERLKNVRSIQSTESAFAALLADGSAFAWGSPGHGGDSSWEAHWYPVTLFSSELFYSINQQENG